MMVRTAMRTAKKCSIAKLCRCITLFCIFFALVAPPWQETDRCNIFWRTLHKTTIFLFFFKTLIQSFRIHLQKNSPTFGKLNTLKWEWWILRQHELFFKRRFHCHCHRCCLSSIIIKESRNERSDGKWWKKLSPFSLVYSHNFPLALCACSHHLSHFSLVSSSRASCLSTKPWTGSLWRRQGKLPLEPNLAWL